MLDNKTGKSGHPIIRSSDHPPRHVAIIMDGNGRWATRRGLPRTAGHRQGAESVRRIVKAAAELGVEYLTLFGFSSENWSRPKSEVQELMKLLRFYLRSETADLHKNGAQLKVIGDRNALDEDIVKLIENAEKLTEDNDKITLVIALNYGGRDEVARAAKRLAYDVAQGAVQPKDVDEETLPRYLDTYVLPDPDLVIRTSGEARISNFLLWQSAYAEYEFIDTLWPDFTDKIFTRIVGNYAGRTRSYGAVTR